MWEESTYEGMPEYSINLDDGLETKLEVIIDKRSLTVISVKNRKPSSVIEDGFIFVDAKPFKYNRGELQDNGLPDDHSPFPERFREYFDQLGEQVPEIKFRLELCLRNLFQPGPSYNPETENRYEI